MEAATAPSPTRSLLRVDAQLLGPLSLCPVELTTCSRAARTHAVTLAPLHTEDHSPQGGVRPCLEILHFLNNVLLNIQDRETECRPSPHTSLASYPPSSPVTLVLLLLISEKSPERYVLLFSPPPAPTPTSASSAPTTVLAGLARCSHSLGDTPSAPTPRRGPGGLCPAPCTASGPRRRPPPLLD